ncbi:hypothetical protein [Paraburkholderia caballeronis]|uniref:hypothetical protein n=1 Tax=Paraburkholderia caballeronis TaxID=416943 RepID=UPI0010E81899|nr:hypothetical protein [Paraburkholderia caballeronis]TDV18485.1 hypothetical protein C7408_103242 [Paraburkholderia caballeronis]TDV19977.1 hypothetical protein C7406_103199 [Paraburkholderia caballeronis]TDV28194.1 hypothetical protein C7404_103199 [Paraburkholderia caballeronis]
MPILFRGLSRFFVLRRAFDGALRAGVRAFGVAAGALALAAAFAACSPTYDWRVVTNSASGYVVDLPAKPGADERSIDIGGTVVRMRMQTAEAGGAVFVVGTVDLPDARADTQQKALAFLRAGLARNVGVQPDAHEVDVPLTSGGAVQGVEMRMTGAAGAQRQTRTIHVRLVAKGARAYQVAIVADREPPPEQVDQFFGSFKLF